MDWYIYQHSAIHVGKYTSPMDPIFTIWVNDVNVYTPFFV